MLSLRRKSRGWSRGVRQVATVAALSLALAACGADAADSDSAEEIFSGETVRLIVPFGAGGGTDVTARQLVPFLSEHLPGNPQVQVENIEGANSMLGVNQFTQMPQDGLSILMTSASTSTAKTFGDPAAQFEFSDFRAVAGIPAGAVQYVASDVGVEDPVDIFDGAADLVYGGVTPGGSDVTRLLGYEVLGFDVEAVFGYESRAAIQIAFSQGETNIDGQSTATYIESILPLVDRGDAVPVYTHGMTEGEDLITDSAFPDLPTVAELYEKEYGEPPSGEAFEAFKFLVTVSQNLQKPVWMHSEAPEAAVEAVEQAFLDMQKDPDYQSDLQPTIGYDFIMGEELDNAIEVLSDPPQETIDWLADWAKEEYDADLSTG